MSVKHPNISAWQRDAHEGHYNAEVAGYALTVRWSPNTREARGSFHWTAVSGSEKPHRSHGHFEEPESAMADAEDFARAEAARRIFAVVPIAKH